MQTPTAVYQRQWAEAVVSCAHNAATGDTRERRGNAVTCRTAQMQRGVALLPMPRISGVGQMTSAGHDDF